MEEGGIGGGRGRSRVDSQRLFRKADRTRTVIVNIEN